MEQVMDVQTSDDLRYHCERDVAHIQFNRLTKKNAFTRAHWQTLSALVARAEQDKARVLMLRSSGAPFCAGADIGELAANMLDSTWMRANHDDVQTCLQRLAQTSVVTFAVIEGVCVGGGVALAAACDFRFATHASSYQLTPGKLGLSYSKTDIARMVELIGVARTKDMLLSGATLPSIQALTFGFLHELHAINTLDAALQSKIEQVMSMSNASVAALKQNFAELSGGQRADDAAAQARFNAMFESADFVQRAQAFLQRTRAE
jgi:enoyl-CoA hydratase